MKSNHVCVDGRWPLYRGAPDQVQKILNFALRQNLEWGHSQVLGFPSMSPHAVGLHWFSMFLPRHTNAILSHTRGSSASGEKGFDGTAEIERDVIRMVGDLLGIVCPSEDSSANNHDHPYAELSPVRDQQAKPEFPGVDGYITSGGTEANIMGVWVGRNYLLKEFADPVDSKRVAVMASPFIHYSLRKACELTGLGEGTWLECPSCVDPLVGPERGQIQHVFQPDPSGWGLHMVRANAIGQIVVEDLESQIRSLHDEKGVRRFLILLNEGTTMTGAMDPTKEVGDMVARLEEEWEQEVGFYIHVDAAYGGFIYPFLNPDGRWAFRVPQVDSVTIDPYKMGQCPLAEGIFLCRKPPGEKYANHGLLRYIERRTGYVNDHVDDTLAGSRCGAFAAACWAVFRSEGTEGFEEMHLASRETAVRFANELKQVPRIEVLPPQLNMVTVVLPNNLMKVEYQMLEDTVVKAYCLMWDWISLNPQDPEAHVRRLMKFNITRDVKSVWLTEVRDQLLHMMRT